MDCSMLGLPVHHKLPELNQTHVHQVSDVIQPSHPLSSPSPSAFNLSQHQGLFQWVSSLHQVAKVIGASALASVLPMSIQDWFPLGLTGLIFLQSSGLSGVFSSTTVQKHQFFGIQPSLWSNSHIHTWLLEKPSSGNEVAAKHWTDKELVSRIYKKLSTLMKKKTNNLIKSGWKIWTDTFLKPTFGCRVRTWKGTRHR